MSITERTLSPDQRATLLTILSDVAAIRAHCRIIDFPRTGSQSVSICKIGEHLDAITHKVRRVNGGGQA